MDLGFHWSAIAICNGLWTQNIYIVVNDPNGSGISQCALYTSLGPCRLRYVMGLRTQNIYALWLTMSSGPVHSGAHYVLVLIAISRKGELCMFVEYFLLSKHWYRNRDAMGGFEVWKVPMNDMNEGLERVIGESCGRVLLRGLNH